MLKSWVFLIPVSSSVKRKERASRVLSKYVYHSDEKETEKLSDCPAGLKEYLYRGYEFGSKRKMKLGREILYRVSQRHVTT